MSVRIQYAYLKQQTWLYRRNYPKELQPLLGQAYKQSLKTGDARVEGKAKPQHYEAMTDEEVLRLLSLDDPRIGVPLRLCLLSGMRAGEAVGLVREDLIWKGNLGWFAWIRPNEVRSLKTDAAERLIPLHSSLTPLLAALPATGRLFPGLSVNMVTKRFTMLRDQAGIIRAPLPLRWTSRACTSRS